MDTVALREASRAKLIADIKTVVADAEDYLAASVTQTGDAYAAARMKLERTLNATKTQLAETGRAVSEKTRSIARATDACVHDRPWQSIAIGGGVGMLLGLLLARR